MFFLKLKNLLLNFFFPEACLFCHKVSFDSREEICEECFLKLCEEWIESRCSRCGRAYHGKCPYKITPYVAITHVLDDTSMAKYLLKQAEKRRSKKLVKLLASLYVIRYCKQNWPLFNQVKPARFMGKSRWLKQSLLKEIESYFPNREEDQEEVLLVFGPEFSEKECDLKKSKHKKQLFLSLYAH